nr:vesicular glutamate transporter [Biomphalaria glabrata]
MPFGAFTNLKDRVLQPSKDAAQLAKDSIHSRYCWLDSELCEKVTPDICIFLRVEVAYKTGCRTRVRRLADSTVNSTLSPALNVNVVNTQISLSDDNQLTAL